MFCFENINTCSFKGEHDADLNTTYMHSQFYYAGPKINNHIYNRACSMMWMLCMWTTYISWEKNILNSNF